MKHATLRETVHYLSTLCMSAEYTTYSIALLAPSVNKHTHTCADAVSNRMLPIVLGPSYNNRHGDRGDVVCMFSITPP